MKTFNKLLILFFCMILCFSCSKEEFFEKPQPELKSGILKVYPSSAADILVKAEEDWNNINEALQNAGQGQTVRLAEGLFYLSKSIICWDFNGTLKGAGMDKTIIQTAPGMLFDVAECPPLNWSFENNDGFFMFCFAHHYNTEVRTVTVSDLQIIVDEPSTPYFRLKTSTPEEGNALQAIHVQYENLDNDLDHPIHLNVVYKNLKIIGVSDLGTYLNGGYSLMAGLVGFGASCGSFEAKNVVVENAGTGILAHVFNGENSIVGLKNSKLDNNINGIFSFLSTCWLVMNNEIENSVASVFLNKYRGRTDVTLPSGKSMIKENILSLSNGAGFVGIQLDNTDVKDNVFYGTGFTGIYTEGGNALTIKGNNLCDVVAYNPYSRTIGLIQPMNFVVKDNFNQILGPFVLDPSNIIGEGSECNE